MKIVRAELLYQTIPLKRPFVTALRRVDAAESFILRLTAETGRNRARRGFTYGCHNG